MMCRFDNFSRRVLPLCAAGMLLSLKAHSQVADYGTYDFGYVPIGTTNTQSGYEWSGGSYGGTQTVMAVETIIGPNAADFSVSPNYQGQTFDFGVDYPYSVTFVPQVSGFETATFTNFETPSPPFGGIIVHLRGVGIPAARPGSGPVVPELGALEQAMTNYLVAHQFEAGTIALMHDSKLVLRQGYGWRDTNFTTVIHPDNIFRLASVSKMLTASAIQKLVDGGKITTSTKIYSYLGIPPWGGVLGDTRITNITVQNLLDHSGGWDRDTSPVGDAVFDTIEVSTNLGLDYPAAPTNLISWMFSKPLDFAPGTSNVYSNFGYQVLGRVIEKASGKRYVDYIQQDLLGSAGLINPLGFTNVIQAHSRPNELAPWEIWYADSPSDITQSAVDYPTNIYVRFTDGGGYYESFDSFGGMCASAIGLCHYLLNYLEGGDVRSPGENFSRNINFYGSLPGTTTVLYQNITQNSTRTNGLEFAVLFNQRDNDPNDNDEANTAIVNACATITSWPTNNGGGMVQWAVGGTNVNKNSGSVTVRLTRTGTVTLPVKISYTTYGITAGNSNYIPTSGIISFASGVTGTNITVPILNDGVIDLPRQFSLELISASGGAWLGTNLSSLVTILDTNTVPKFTEPLVRLANGNFQAQVQASTGLVITLQVSTDLVNWQNLQTFTNYTPTSTLTDTTASTRLKSFYRLAVP